MGDLELSTESLFAQDAYLQSCEARIEQVNDIGILLDRTVFYPRGGGQAGDSGWLLLADGTQVQIADTRKAVVEGAGENDIVHIPAADQDELLQRLAVGEIVQARIDWDRRFRLMRFHTASHLMCSVLPYPVDGCSITADYARLDFVTSDPLSREDIEGRLAALVAASKSVSAETITVEALMANPELIRTMSVKPPMGTGHIRLVRIEDVDLQPCGGTHVACTAEVGAIRVTKMEKKTARTRRVVLGFA
ncbi:alanyl-tRNA editing protein [Pseudomonas chlororaphis]|uniref:alanyl-tRNA editing protein n=1 Tax=Pseudomonas chlororaphis TaxID=587753 RepID=UPI00190F3A6C|nr:alanyl-tRNA editing protein [Pseudomonas chlororaphis]